MFHLGREDNAIAVGRRCDNVIFVLDNVGIAKELQQKTKDDYHKDTSSDYGL